VALKNLLVHLDQRERSQARLELAVALARRHGARLVGLFGQLAHAHQVGLVASWPPPAYAQAAEASRARFAATVGNLPEAQWIDANRGSEAEVVRVVTNAARHFDLVVMGQHEDAAGAQVPPDLVAEVVHASGRPVLIVPYIGDFAHVGSRPLVGWSDTRESARALTDAIPLLQGCERAHVLSVADRVEDAEAACTAAALHLGCHGIRAEVEALASPGDGSIGVMDLLLNRITDLAADLLVMGGHRTESGLFGGSRGAGTRHVLRQMTAPVLMSS